MRTRTRHSMDDHKQNSLTHEFQEVAGLLLLVQHESQRIGQRVILVFECKSGFRFYVGLFRHGGIDVTT